MKGKKTDMKKILVVAAHPDDEILGVGATVAKHAAQGDEVYALILGEGQTSRGEHREDISADVVKELHQNTLESAEKVGYKEVYFADFPDNRFDQVDLLDVVKAVEHKIKEIQPEIIYTHYSGDLNIDHQYTARAVLTATRPIGDYPAFCPNVYVDITQFYANKEAAMKCYVSELCEYPHPRSLEGMDVLSRTRGIAAGMNRAEAFMLIRSMR